MVGASRKTDWDSSSCWTLGTGFRKWKQQELGSQHFPILLIWCSWGFPSFCAPQETSEVAPPCFFALIKQNYPAQQFHGALGEHISVLMLPHGHPGSRKVRTPDTWVWRASDLPGCSASSNVDKEFREPGSLLLYNDCSTWSCPSLRWKATGNQWLLKEGEWLRLLLVRGSTPARCPEINSLMNYPIPRVSPKHMYTWTTKWTQ